MKLMLWNVEWAPTKLKRNFISQTLEQERPAVFCLTESTVLVCQKFQNVISSKSDYGYVHDGGRRKVWLISEREWTDVEYAENCDLPPGRFVSGISFGIRFVGVCVPWFDAHVTGGMKNRKRWEDHKTFLIALKGILAQYAASDIPVCILGDFNQRVPATAWNAKYIQYLHDALGDDFSLDTTGLIDSDKQKLIDHVATSSQIQFNLERTISRKADHGRFISDHPGLIGRLEEVLS